MLRSEELTEKIQKLVDELATMKSKIEVEQREHTDEEMKKANTIMDEVESLQVSLDSALTEERTDAKLREMKSPQRKAVRPEVARGEVQEKRFKTFGEFLQAVMMSQSPGGYMDHRLNRAATGMSEGIPSDGGFLVQTDFAAELIKRVYETGQVVSRARRIPISGTANGLKLNAVAETSRAAGSRWGGILGYWLSEAGTKTASAPKFRQMELSLKKLIGLCYATDELLQDAAALEGVIMQGFREEFGFLLDDALINGTGVGQPLGIMNSACRVAVTRNTAAHVYSQDIINLWSRGYARSRPNFVWFINQDIEPELFQMNMGGSGTAVSIGGAGVNQAYLPPGGLSGQPYGTLMGRPVIPIEQCQTLGENIAPHICENMMNNSQIQGNLNYARA